jgi:hypothetical protein
VFGGHPPKFERDKNFRGEPVDGDTIEAAKVFRGGRSGTHLLLLISLPRRNGSSSTAQAAKRVSLVPP